MALSVPDKAAVIFAREVESYDAATTSMAADGVAPATTELQKKLPRNEGWALANERREWVREGEEGEEEKGIPA